MITWHKLELVSLGDGKVIL